ncbi:MvaI/BcnI family restriction endonuclease [Shewanella sp. SM20]|uniref:MvaI/BcnI family restriction endonuclease n=1 Tax=Shewanella TaxID=22 RepID=UPI0021D89570|nr:MvaI/BcnI family restriction endonuclease [Shewanella sp. SM20]MCU8092598.1 MvaI/BcnI family restriction endonuclease [Shewanella sp. SM20]
MMTSFKAISEQMRKLGASRIFFKSLANNDNTKQQIYLGSEFDVIRSIPSGEIYADGISKKGPIFKAPLDFYWMDEDGNTDRAPNSQIILYPKYPEIRMSGFLAGTNRKLDITPRHLMQPPTLEERAERMGMHRYLVLGVNKTTIWAYCTSWEDELALELKQLVVDSKAKLVASVFYESVAVGKTSEEKLLDKLRAIYEGGPIESCRLQADGTKIPYKAQNGGGYTLEAQFNITPNGCADPDFMDWELKSHSGSVVTLMTPEPNTGIYIEHGLKTFLDCYATRKQEERLDFASRHDVNKENSKTNLTMKMEGYDSKSGKITDPDGGLMLRDKDGKLAAGWSFDKVIDHWKRKHSNTCYVTYTANKDNELPHYSYGPQVTLGQGTSLEHFLKSLYNCAIYYDPGINMKLESGKWKPKKRSQFRVKWKDINQLYRSLRELDLREA